MDRHPAPMPTQRPDPTAPTDATAAPAPEAIVELKSTTLSAVTLMVNGPDLEALRAALVEKLAEAPGYLDGEAVVIDLSRLSLADAESLDLEALAAMLRGQALLPVAVRALPGHAAPLAARLGLVAAPAAPADRRPARPVAEPTLPAAPTRSTAAPQAAMVTALVVDKPLRSGQRVYARGRDLVLLAGVSPGAEVIADGSIHCYGPLRGRALAGATGALDARIYAGRFEAELVSIGGVWRTFEVIDDAVRDRAVRISLRGDGDAQSILIETVDQD